MQTVFRLDRGTWRLLGPAAPLVRPRDGVPAARGGVAVAVPPPARVHVLVSEAVEESSASALPAVERMGGSAVSSGGGTDHST